MGHLPCAMHVSAARAAACAAKASKKLTKGRKTSYKLTAPRSRTNKTKQSQSCGEGCWCLLASSLTRCAWHARVVARRGCVDLGSAVCAAALNPQHGRRLWGCHHARSCSGAPGCEVRLPLNTMMNPDGALVRTRRSLLLFLPLFPIILTLLHCFERLQNNPDFVAKVSSLETRKCRS